MVDTPRSRRAVGLIAAALTVCVVAGLLWLRANAPPPAPTYPVPSPIPVLPFEYSVSYSFVSASTGWAVMARGGLLDFIEVYRTNDGARHWLRISTGPSLVGPVELRFVDRTDGFAWGFETGFSMLRTEDGGVHWTRVTFPATPAYATFADGAHGWYLAVEGEGPNQRYMLSSTTDGGTTWSPRAWPFDAIYPGKGGPDEPVFRSNGEGWVGGFFTTPQVHVTADGGQTWQTRNFSTPPEAIPSPVPGKPGFVPLYSTTVQLLPDRGVVAIIDFGAGLQQAYTTFDLGSTWQPVTQPRDSILYSDLTFLDSRHWWAFRYGFLFKTADAGLTWKETRVAPLQEGWNYLPAHPVDPTHAWSQMTSTRAQGSGLSMTSDGGANWRVVNVPQPG